MFPKRSTTSRCTVSPRVGSPTPGATGAPCTGVGRRGSGPPGRSSADASSPTSARLSSAYSRDSSRSIGTSANSGSPYHASRSAKASLAHSVIGVHVVGARVTHPSEVEPFEQAQLLQEHGSLAPRTGLERAEPVIVDRERLFVRRPPVAQVLLREQAAVALAGAVHPLLGLEAHERLRDEAAVPAVESRVDVSLRLVEDPPVRRRKLRVAVQRSRLRHRQIHGCRRRPLVAKERLDVANGPRDLRQHGIAVLRVADGETQHVGERQRPVVAQHREPAAERAGHDRGERSRPGHEVEPEVVAVARDRRSPRRRPLRAQDDGLVAGAPEQRGKIAARTVQMRLDDLQREARGNGCVECVTALLENRHSCGRRKPVRRRNHAERTPELRSCREHSRGTVLTQERTTRQRAAAVSRTRRTAGRARALPRPRHHRGSRRPNRRSSRSRY